MGKNGDRDTDNFCSQWLGQKRKWLNQREGSEMEEVDRFQRQM